MIEHEHDFARSKLQVPRVWKNPSRSVPLFLLATAVYVDECVDVGSLGEVAE